MSDDNSTQRYDWNLSREQGSQAYQYGSGGGGDAHPYGQQRPTETTQELDLSPRPAQPAATQPRQDRDETPTRAYNFSPQPQSAYQQSAYQPQHTEYQPQRTASPTPSAPQTSAGSSAAPAYGASQTGTPSYAPAANQGNPYWMDQPSGPSAGARIGSIILALLGAGMLGGIWWSDAAAYADGSVSFLRDALSGLENFAPLVLLALTILGWLLIGIALLLSGLGPAVIGTIGLLATVVYVAIRIVTTGNLPFYDEPDYGVWMSAQQTMVLSAAMLFTGIAAHFSRRAGFQRAVRLARGR